MSYKSFKAVLDDRKPLKAQHKIMMLFFLLNFLVSFLINIQSEHDSIIWPFCFIIVFSFIIFFYYCICFYYNNNTFSANSATAQCGPWIFPFSRDLVLLWSFTVNVIVVVVLYSWIQAEKISFQTSHKNREVHAYGNWLWLGQFQFTVSSLIAKLNANNSATERHSAERRRDFISPPT